jgi:hypothetical protein
MSRAVLETFCVIHKQREMDCSVLVQMLSTDWQTENNKIFRRANIQSGYTY